MYATPCVRRADLIAYPDGEFTARGPGDTVLSVQPDGKIDHMPAGTNGPYEKGPVVGNKLILTCHVYPSGHYAILVVD